MARTFALEIVTPDRLVLHKEVESVTATGVGGEFTALPLHVPFLAALAIGTLSYRPPAALARHVRLRDGTCRFPGCAVPARECDLDHLIPFPQGPTSAGNLHALCRRHHSLKHEDGWTVQADDRHGLRWTSPHGATATTYPDDTLAAVA